MVVNGSLSKSAVNASAGARSQLSGLIVAGLTILTLLALTGLFEDLPEATLAAVVMAAVVELVDVPGLVSLYGAYSRRLGREFGLVARPDFIAAIAALLGVTVFDTLPGLFIGITASLLLLAYRASRPYVATLGRTPGRDGHYRDIDRHPDAALPAHIVVLRIESGLYFANADAVRARILRAASADGIRAVVVDGETIPFIDVTASRMLADLAEELRQQRVQLLIARDVGQVRDILSHVIDDAALAHFYPTVQAAIDATGHDQPAPLRRARTSRASRVDRTESREDDEDVDR